jgi:hypothetical protein
MKRAAFALLVTLLMASCAHPASPASGEPTDGGPASITISATYDQSSCCYVEGFIPFVRIVGSEVDVKKKFALNDDGIAEVAFEVPRGGEYKIESWVEPCAANCGEPRDPATDHCWASVTVPDGEKLQVDLTIRTAHPCRLAVAMPY